MATDAEVTAGGYALPQGQEAVAGGDEAIRQNAHTAYETIRETQLRAGGIDGQPLVVTATDDMDDFLTTVDIRVNSPLLVPANWPTDPDAQAIALGRVQQVGNVVEQRISTRYGMWSRWSGSTGWWPWQRLDAGGVEIPDPPSIPAPRPSTTGLRTSMLRLSCSGSYSSVPALSCVVRVPVHLGPKVTRWRVHISNRSDRWENHRPALTGTGLWVGPGWNGAFTSAPVQVAPAFTVPGDGTDYVSPWVSTVPLGAGQQMMLSAGLSSTAEVIRTTGGCWQADGSTAGAGASAAPAGSAMQGLIPGNWWIEAEFDGSVPVVAMWGDSITAGTGNTLPVNDAPLAQWARQRGAMPLLVASPGSQMAEWTDPDDHWWTTVYADQAPDAVIHWMGQNNMQEGNTLAQLQQWYTDSMVGLTKLAGAAPIYLATITPSAIKSDALDALRKSYNTWLRTLPGGARDLFDLAAAVSNDDRALKGTADSGDGLHLSTAGSAMVADTLSARPLVASTAVDTGWKRLPTGDTAGSIRDPAHPGTFDIRREGSRVILRVAGVRLASGTGTGFILPNGIPEGYRGGPVRVAGQLRDDYSTAWTHEVTVADNDLSWIAYATHNVRSNVRPVVGYLQGEISWTTDDPAT